MSIERPRGLHDPRPELEENATRVHSEHTLNGALAFNLGQQQAFGPTKSALGWCGRGVLLCYPFSHCQNCPCAFGAECAVSAAERTGGAA